MDVRLEHGIIGEYQGLDVYVIAKGEFEEDFDAYCDDEDTIYVVVDERNKKPESLMVLEGDVIGHLSPSGGVTEYNNPFAYLVGKKKAEAIKKAIPTSTKATEVEVEPVDEPLGSIDIDKFIQDALSIDLLEGWSDRMGCSATLDFVG